ncbi:ArsR family transcriptional regulator [Faecalibacillus faecis]|uniref:ArsR family transcriptional regulator n=1 Tax=Faecalibacillus faecis TaxID=1982628 RepID=UPI0022E587E5|nr:ArsR family transcriptional regulator [Faecalibacillus faecis]
MDPIAALRLSIACKNRQKDYYETFKITNDVRNKGDITYFVLQFLDILKTGLEDYLDDFTDKVNQYHYYQKKQSQLDLNHSSRTILETVIDYSLFYLEPITLTKLVELTHLSKSTISNHLNKLEKDGLVEKSKPGKNCLFHFKKMHNKMNPLLMQGFILLYVFN